MVSFTFFLSPEFSVFVGDLTSEVDDFQLLQFFQKKFPSCKGAKVVTDPYGNSRYDIFQPPTLYCITLLGFLWQFDLLMLTKDEVVELEEVSFTFFLFLLSVDTLYLPSPKKGQTIHGCDLPLLQIC